MASLIQRPDSSTYYIQYMVSGKAKRVSTETESLQIAKEKLRQFESAQARGETLPLPTRTPIASVVAAYVSHIRTVKTAKSAQTDTYYLRDAFGAICPALEVNSRKVSAKAKKRPPKPGQDRRRRTAVIEASCFEQITTADIAAFISSRMKSRGLAPKTANRYREILTRMFNWAMTQNGVRMPRDKNPAASVGRRYRRRVRGLESSDIGHPHQCRPALEPLPCIRLRTRLAMNTRRSLGSFVQWHITNSTTTQTRCFLPTLTTGTDSTGKRALFFQQIRRLRRQRQAEGENRASSNQFTVLFTAFGSRMSMR